MAKTHVPFDARVSRQANLANVRTAIDKQRKLTAAARAIGDTIRAKKQAAKRTPTPVPGIPPLTTTARQTKPKV